MGQKGLAERAGYPRCIHGDTTGEGAGDRAGGVGYVTFRAARDYLADCL